MKIDYSPRQSGRTTKLIEELVTNPNAILLCYSKKEADRVKGLILGASNFAQSTRERVHYWLDYKNKFSHRYEERQKVLVDNADYILEQAIGTFVDLATITKAEITLRKDD